MVWASALTVAASNFISFLAIFARSPIALPMAFMAASRSSIGDAASTAEPASVTASRPEATVSTFLFDMHVSRRLRHRLARCLAGYATDLVTIPGRQRLA